MHTTIMTVCVLYVFLLNSPDLKFICCPSNCYNTGNKNPTFLGGLRWQVSQNKTNKQKKSHKLQLTFEFSL